MITHKSFKDRDDAYDYADKIRDKHPLVFKIKEDYIVLTLNEDSDVKNS